MTYEEIIKLDDLKDRETLLKEYYEKEVKVLDWMYDENLTQIIVFKDRTEYKHNNEYHRLDGPAIDNNYGDGSYYINGQIMRYDEWKILSTKIMRELKLTRALK